MTQLTSLSAVRTALAAMDFHPSKVLGQNFLVDGNILDILIREAQLTGRERVVEVGPGLGVVTERLLECAGSVVAVEKDVRLHAWLRDRFAGHAKLELICADAVKHDFRPHLPDRSARFVSNLPYSVGNRILIALAQLDCRPERMVVTVQQEVAERICAPPGGKQFGLLSVWLQLHYEPRIAHTVSANCFWPRPAVSSSIVSLVRRQEPIIAPHLEVDLYAITRAAFAQRRKKIAGVLAGSLPQTCTLTAARVRELLEQTGLNSEARPEGLSARGGPRC